MGEKTNVILITGFLGSGKTTFLNRIITAFPEDRKLMILMNEFGEVGLDGTLIEGDDMDILEISKGSIFCVCVKTDFIRGLNDIAQKIQPDVLIVESTGVANPSDLKKDLNLSIFKNRFQLKDQICLVDADCFEDAYEAFVSVEKQIASSSLFIINKVDLATPEKIKNIHHIIHQHHPSPDIIETTFAQIPLNRFTGMDAPETREAGSDPAVTETDLEAVIDELLKNPDPDAVPPDRLLSAVYAWSGSGKETFMSFADTLPDNIVRAKGILKFDTGLHLFNRVMANQTLEPYASNKELGHLINQLVLIGPPEAISQLEVMAQDAPYLEKKSIFDPMKAR